MTANVLITIRPFAQQMLSTGEIYGMPKEANNLLKIDPAGNVSTVGDFSSLRDGNKFK